MKQIKRLTWILLGVMTVLSLFGCGRPKYKLQFDGGGFESKKTAYAAGEKVTAYYGLIATDTDYRFWLDDEDVKLKQDWDDARGFVFTFVMPDHDVTLHVESHNSMLALEQLRVTFRNEVEEADVWVLPQTEENLKTTLWGPATVEKLGVGEAADLNLIEETGRWLVRIIDGDRAYYAAQDLVLETGYEIVFRSEGEKYDAVIEVLDQNGAVVSSQAAFAGVLGGA